MILLSLQENTSIKQKKEKKSKKSKKEKKEKKKSKKEKRKTAQDGSSSDGSEVGPQVILLKLKWISIKRQKYRT